MSQDPKTASYFLLPPPVLPLSFSGQLLLCPWAAPLHAG